MVIANYFFQFTPVLAILILVVTAALSFLYGKDSKRKHVYIFTSIAILAAGYVVWYFLPYSYSSVILGNAEVVRIRWQESTQVQENVVRWESYDYTPDSTQNEELLALLAGLKVQRGVGQFPVQLWQGEQAEISIHILDTAGKVKEQLYFVVADGTLDSTSSQTLYAFTSDNVKVLEAEALMNYVRTLKDHPS